jgi:hypothetical protein
MWKAMLFDASIILIS